MLQYNDESKIERLLTLFFILHLVVMKMPPRALWTKGKQILVQRTICPWHCNNNWYHPWVWPFFVHWKAYSEWISILFQQLTQDSIYHTKYLQFNN